MVLSLSIANLIGYGTGMEGLKLIMKQVIDNRGKYLGKNGITFNRLCINILDIWICVYSDDTQL